MTSIASQRLIEASGTLEPADRALLNLLVNHGFDDGAVARLTRASPAAIASQRESLVEHLSIALELPPAIVRDAVDELTTSARGPAAATAPSARDGNHVPDAAIAATDAGPSIAPAPAAASASAASSRTGVSRRGALGVVAAALAIAVALVVILASGNAKHRATAARKLTTPAPPAQPAPAAQPAPTQAVQSGHGALAGLPGGPVGVTGSLTIVGPSTRSRLVLTVSGLPSARSSHYELWLYNSIIDAVPLARLGAPRASLGVLLPPGFHRYRWLDISLQPPGSVNHSGESIVRAAVPG